MNVIIAVIGIYCVATWIVMFKLHWRYLVSDPDVRWMTLFAPIALPLMIYQISTIDYQEDDRG